MLDSTAGKLKLIFASVLYCFLTLWLLILVGCCCMGCLTMHGPLSDAHSCSQPFIEEGQPILQLFPRREIAALGVAFLIILTCCIVCFVIGLHLLLPE